MVKKAAKAKPATKKNDEKPIKTGNPHGGFFGHMYRRYKGNMKKAHTAYTAVAHSVREITKTKGKDYMIRDYLDSQYGRKLGKKHKDPGHVTLDFKRFAQKYNPQTFKKIEEETDMAKLDEGLGRTIDKAFGSPMQKRRVTALANRRLDNLSPKSLENGKAFLRMAKHVETDIKGKSGNAEDNFENHPTWKTEWAKQNTKRSHELASSATRAYGALKKIHGDKWIHYRESVDDEQFVQDLIDLGATEEDIANLITEEQEEPNMELHAAFLDAILNEKPLDATELFEELIAEKLANTVEAYKEMVAESLFLDPPEEDDENDEDEESEELTEEDLEELANLDLDELTDEELEELASLFDNIEEVEEELEDEGEEVVEDDEAPLH